jgi:hypothetical protein
MGFPLAVDAFLMKNDGEAIDRAAGKPQTTMAAAMARQWLVSTFAVWCRWCGEHRGGEPTRLK